MKKSSFFGFWILGSVAILIVFALFFLIFGIKADYYVPVPAVVLLALFILLINDTHKSKQIRDEQIIAISKKYPDVFEALGVEITGAVPLIPDDLVERAVWFALPNELSSEIFTDEPQIAITPNLVLSYDKEQNNDELKVLQAVESSVAVYTFFSGMYAMMKKLKIFDTRYIYALRRELSYFSEAAHRDNMYLYGRNRPLWVGSNSLTPWGRYYISDIIIAEHIKQMKRICDAMNVDYDSMGLGEYDPEKSSFVGAGSWGMIGLAAALSAGSTMSAKNKAQKFNEASLFYTYNNISNYFNMKYCTDSDGVINKEFLYDSVYNILDGERHKPGKNKAAKVQNLTYSPDSSLFGSHDKQEIERIREMISEAETLGVRFPKAALYTFAAFFLLMPVAIIMTETDSLMGSGFALLFASFVGMFAALWYVANHSQKTYKALDRRIALLDSYLDFIKGVESPNMRRTVTRKISG